MKTKHLTLTALYLAVIIISGLVAIPTPVGVPIVLQNMVCAMGGGLLGKKYGTLAVAIFLLCVAIGLPVLPGGRSGVAVFFGVTGSFFIGYLLSPLFVGLAVEKLKTKNFLNLFIILWLFGVLFVNLTGIISLTYHGSTVSVAFKTVLGFIPMGTVKAAVAAFVLARILKNWKMS